MNEECIWEMNVKGIGGARESSVKIMRRMDWGSVGDAPYEIIKYDVRAYLGHYEDSSGYQHMLEKVVESFPYDDGGFACAQRYAVELASWVIHAITLPSWPKRKEFIEACHETWGKREAGA